METLDGTVEHIVFANEDTGFTVIDLAASDEELITVVGILPGLAPGEQVSLTGVYTAHPTYGRQFKAELCQRTLPATATAIQKYLSSGAIKGVGPKTAKRLVDTFGENTLEVIETDPNQLTTVPRISFSKALEIHEEYKKIFGIRSVMISLSRYGIEPTLAIRVWKKWGLMSIEKIEENPYIICTEAIGGSFQKADEIAFQLKIEENDPIRVQSGLIYALDENQNNGHTCLPEEVLISTAASLLGIDMMYLEDSLVATVEEGLLLSVNVNGEDFIYLPDLYVAESYIAGRLNLMLLDHPPDPSSYQEELDWLEGELDIEYADLQKRAVSSALDQPVFILTGGPGTGKTTALNGIITLMEHQGLKVALAAPTGRAAQRMTEVTGRDAQTIHRLLEVDFRSPDSEATLFKRNEKNPLRVDVVILDEVSMVDTRIMYSLLKALPLNCRLILVGDPDQLPSVGAGNIIGDLIDSDVIPTVHLTEIFRQARQSQIVISSHEIVRGTYPDLTIRDSDFFFLDRNSYESTLATTLDLCKRRLPKAYSCDPLWDIQVISPSRVGVLGTIELNKHLQLHLNPPSITAEEHKFGDVIFRENDKIMQVRNNYDIIWRDSDGLEGSGIFNGDIGVIEMIDKPSQTILINFDDKIAEYHFDMANELEHAYAITVHKSQGSEFPIVVMPLMNYHPKLYYRNILYTGVTRAEDLMIILGKPQTISKMVENNRKVLRYTNLATFIEESVLGKGDSHA